MRDETGQPIFRIDRSPTTNAARMTIGNPLKAQVVAGVLPSGDTALQLVGNDGKVRVALYADDMERAVSITGQSGQKVSMTTNGPKGAVRVVNSGGMPVSILSSTVNGFGRLEIANASGQNVVEASTLTNGQGIVRAGAAMGGTTGGVGQPWAIVGRVK